MKIIICFLFLLIKCSNNKFNNENYYSEIDMGKEVAIKNCRICHHPGSRATDFGVPEDEMISNFKNIDDFKKFIKSEFNNEKNYSNKHIQHKDIKLNKNEIDVIIKFIEDR